jgi:CheY-like chemotaxis protein
MRRYLVVDDNLAFAENLAEILRDQGAEAAVAPGGEEALAALRETRFDALITDMRMPRIGGAELVREARRFDPGLPVIVVSAWTDAGDLHSAEEAGLLAILPKPTPIADLLQKLSVARRDGVVVLVDDDLALVENLSEALRQRGFSVLAAHTLDQVGKLGIAPFAAVVDLRMPGGPDGAAILALRDRFPLLPMLVITGFPQELTPIPVAAFIKPFDTGALLATLERLHEEQA